MTLDFETILNSDINFTFFTSYGTISRQEQIKNHYVCPKNSRTTSRLFLVLNDKIKFNFSDSAGTAKEVYASPGDIVYLPPDIAYVSKWEGLSCIEYISIEFLAETISHKPITLGSDIFIICRDDYDVFKSAFSAFFNTYTGDTAGYKFKCRSMLYEIFMNIIKENLKKEYKNTDSSIYKSVMYLENNYIEDISVSELAMMSNTCESNYRSKFKKLKGMSPIEYKNYLKIRKAAELLLSDKYSIKEVAYTINIPDVCYFNKLFKRYYKMPPSEYKLKHSQKFINSD